MKLKQLLAKLIEIEKQHGDIEIYIDDADTGWFLSLEEVHTNKFSEFSSEIVVVVGGSYHNGRIIK